MKVGWIALPVATVLAIAGGILYYVADQPPSAAPFVMNVGPKHPVTETMVKLTASLAATTVPTTEGITTEHRTFVFAPQHATRPQLIYFVLDGCPCSYDAEPLFKKLGLKFKNRVEFACVTNAKAEDARKWDVAQTPPYPVVYDPDLRLIHLFGATNSVFSVLLDVNGRVLKMWPGYSKSILIEMNSLISKAAGVPVTPFDPEYAPEAKTSGCPFAEVRHG